MAYHHGDLREALLTAAETLLHESGPAGVTLRACARRAGVSHAAPQHHFRDLADLLAEVAARGFERFSDRLQTALADAGEDARARYIAVAQTYVGFARSDPALFRLMFRSDVLNSENEALLHASRRSYAAMVSSIVLHRGDAPVTAENLQQRSHEPGLMQDILISWGYLHGFAQLLLEGQLDVFIEEGESVDVYVERMLAATGARLSWLLQQQGGG
jgi:AcrR family transcriptional regulator